MREVVLKRSRRGLLVLGALGLGAAVSFFACLEATQIDGELSSDTSICAPSSGARTRFAIRVSWIDGDISDPRQTDGELERCDSREASSLLGNFTLLPESPDGREHLELVEVLIDTLGGDPSSCADHDVSGARKLPPNCAVLRRKVRFVPHRALKVPLYVDDRCLGVTCDQDSTCFRGLCKPADAPCDPSTGSCVPEHERALSPGGAGYDPTKPANLPPGAIGRNDAGLNVFPDGATTDDAGNVVTDDGSVIAPDGAVLPPDASSDASTDGWVSTDGWAPPDGAPDVYIPGPDGSYPDGATYDGGGTPQSDCRSCGKSCCSPTGQMPFYCRPACLPGESTCTTTMGSDGGASGMTNCSAL